MLSVSTVGEFIGTLVFLTIILKSGGDKYVVIAGLLAAILLMQGVAGEFNPAVTFMKWSMSQHSNATAVSHVVAQLLGAFVAIRFANLNTLKF